MVRIGIAGIGFMGLTHFRASGSLRSGRVTAICSRSARKRAGDWRGIGGNFGSGGEKVDLANVETFSDYDELIHSPDVDLVDICYPSDQHADRAVAALRAGKHVLVEKPIALTSWDATRMVRAAKRYDRHLMVAHVLPFFPEYAWLAETIEAGTYGDLLGAHFKRVISRLDWSGGSLNLARSGGPGVDLHIHDVHFIQLVFGQPNRITASGRLVEEAYVEYASTTYLYDEKPDLTVTCASGAISKKGRPFTQGFEIYAEGATIAYEASTLGGKPHVATPLSVITDDGKVRKPRLRGGDAFRREMQAAVNVVRTGRSSSALSADRAAAALKLCFKEAESVRRGRTVNV